MLALRYAYLLALIVWLGGMIALGAVVAPAVFGALEESHGVAGRELAGTVFGEVLRRFHYVAYACAAIMLAALLAMKMLGPRPIDLRIRAIIVGVMLASALWSGLGINRRLATLRREVGAPVSDLDASDPRRAAFGRLHRLSTALILVNIAGGLALLYFEARTHD